MNISIIVFALIGLYIAVRIAKEKKQKLAGQKMVCFVGQDCEKVVFSEYSKFLGISLEKMGILYYLVVAIVYLTATVYPPLTNDLVMFVLLGMTFGGFIFSIYLTLLQILKLKNFCSWCISSAVTSTVIFILALIKNVVMENAVIEYFESFQNIISATKTFSLVLIYAIAIMTIFKRTKSISSVRTMWQINLFALFLYVLSCINSYFVFNSNEALVVILLVMNFINLQLTKRLIISSTKTTIQ